MIGLVDLPVSLLGLAGLKFPSDVDGRDLHALFTDKDARGQDACYIYDLLPAHQSPMRGGREWRAIRTRRHTFARSAVDQGNLLFDNVNDPYQMRNLVDDPAAGPLKEELHNALDAFISRHDKLLPWDEFAREFGFKDEWNKSQAYFRLPTLE
jgi:arylsulfatase A-like enzyme